MNGYTLLLVGIALLAGQPAAALEPGTRTVSVSGSGEVRAAPDEATVTLGVIARSPTAAEAQARVNKVVPALLALTHDLKIGESNVRSTDLTVDPEYRSDEKATVQHLVGYRVERRLVVALKDLGRLGELLERSVSLGVNAIEGPELDSSRRKDLEREALALAGADAKRNAEVLATASGATIGPVRAVSMSNYAGPRLRSIAMNAPPPPPGVAESYRVGELTFSVAVDATFDLLPGAAR